MSGLMGVDLLLWRSHPRRRGSRRRRSRKRHRRRNLRRPCSLAGSYWVGSFASLLLCDEVRGGTSGRVK